MRLTALAETDFVDGKVYGLPVALSNLCFAAQCNAGGTCRPDLGSGGFVCATVYRAPGTSGLAPATP